MRRFAMGDLHGAHKALLQCLARSSFDDQLDQLIQLGDVVDGYPDVYECVEELLKVKNLIVLKGNHDDWFQGFLDTGFHEAYWTYGGKGTLISYLNHSGKKGQIRSAGRGYKTSLGVKDIPEAHKTFFESQVLHYTDPQNRFFVHGGFNRHVSIAGQPRDTFYWDRTLWTEALQAHTYDKNIRLPEAFFDAVDFKEIYIGHTPTTKWGTDKPLRALNILNLDTGAGHSGRLTMMDIDTKEYWQSDPLPELYTENFR